jgi:hypothetical protein
MVAFWPAPSPKMTRIPLLRPLFSVFFLIASTAHLWAQSAGRLEGRVTDVTKGVLPGATVEALTPTGTAIVAITDAAGRYELDAL